MYYFEDIIESIENGLRGEIDVNALAKKAGMSVYEFRRIFTFVAKIPLSEYIRKRRLSLAASELITGDISVTDAAISFGYDSTSSFSRAFKEYHGISPADVRKGDRTVKMLSKISVDIVTDGGKDITYSVIDDDEYEITGIASVSEISDTECCESAWASFEQADITAKEQDKIYAAYFNGESSVRCCIGARGCGHKEYDRVVIPKARWVSFTLDTTDDAAVNGFYKDIFAGWLEGAGYKRRIDLPNVEVFPADMSEDGFLWEIRIPIER